MLDPITHLQKIDEIQQQKFSLKQFVVAMADTLKNDQYLKLQKELLRLEDLKIDLKKESIENMHNPFDEKLVIVNSKLNFEE